MPNQRVNPLICSVGSTDPTGAAGVGLDLQIYPLLGARGVFAVAAVSAQNERKVSKIEPVSAHLIRLQLQAIWAQEPPQAVRIGLLPSAAAIAAVARFMAGLRRRPPIVLDPVLAASSGARFAGSAEVAQLRRLFKFATLITPNAPEAAELSGVPVRSAADAQRAAALLSRYGCSVLVKGGHLQGSRSVDILLHDGKVTRFASARANDRMRGKGCRLAAAIAVELARGRALEEAVSRGRAFVQRAMRQQRELRSR